MFKQLVVLSTLPSSICVPAVASTIFTPGEVQYIEYIQRAGVHFVDSESQDFYVSIGRTHCDDMAKDDRHQRFVLGLATSENGFTAATVPAALSYLCPEYREMLPEGLRLE